MNTLYARCAVLWPGLAMSAVVAVAALFLAEHYGAPVMLFALLLGMAVNFLSEDARCKPGIEFVARQVLRWGVALLGLKITLDQVQSLGWYSVFMVVLAVSLTIGLGIVMAKWMGFKPFFGLLSGGSVGICGASAAMAIAAAFPNHPQKDRATLFVVITTCISAFKVFDTVATLTQGRGESEVLLYAIYLEGFQYFKMGYASALTLVFLAFILVFSVWQLRHWDRKVHYA